MATLDKPPTDGSVADLAEELHQLEREEHALEVRTDGVEWKQWIAIAISAFALAVAIFAATMVLTDDDDATQPASTPAVQSGAAATAQPAPDAAAPKAAPAVRRIPVELGEMYVKPSVRTIPAGKVRFDVSNVGSVEHELIVAQKPLMMEGPGMPMHEQGLGMTEHMGPGAREQLRLNMKPGKYQLFCNVPGHYAAGQSTTFTVTKQ